MGVVVVHQTIQLHLRLAGHTPEEENYQTYICSGLRQGFIHLLNGSTSVPSKPNRNDTGQPCKFPEDEESGVLMSA